MKLKTNRHFTKWDHLNMLFVIQCIQYFKNFWISANILLRIPFKIGKKWKRFSVQHILWSSKVLFCFWIEDYIVSTLPNVVKINVENDNVVSTLSNVVQINVEIHKVVSTLLNVLIYNVDVHNVVSTLIWRFEMPWRQIKLKTTMNQRWNVSWVATFPRRLKCSVRQNSSWKRILISSEFQITVIY